jgi:hypothetical protein
LWQVATLEAQLAETKARNTALMEQVERLRAVPAAHPLAGAVEAVRRAHTSEPSSPTPAHAMSAAPPVVPLLHLHLHQQQQQQQQQPYRTTSPGRASQETRAASSSAAVPATWVTGSVPHQLHAALAAAAAAHELTAPHADPAPAEHRAYPAASALEVLAQQPLDTDDSDSPPPAATAAADSARGDSAHPVLSVDEALRAAQLWQSALRPTTPRTEVAQARHMVSQQRGREARSPTRSYSFSTAKRWSEPGAGPVFVITPQHDKQSGARSPRRATIGRGPGHQLPW